MKKYILSLTLLIIAFNVFAQNERNKRRILNETSIVQDSSGMQYPYLVWHKLMESGDYSIKTLNPKADTPHYLLLKLSAEQKAERSSKMPKPAESKFFTTGANIKPFKVRDINGNKVDAKDWAGKTVVLNFWFIGCPPCRKEIPELNDIALRYASNPNVIFIGIALDEAYDIKQFIKTSPFAYHLIDGGRYYANMFNINLYPTNVVIDREGKVRFHASGYTLNTPYWIEKTIQESEKTAQL